MRRSASPSALQSASTRSHPLDRPGRCRYRPASPSRREPATDRHQRSLPAAGFVAAGPAATPSRALCRGRSRHRHPLLPAGTLDPSPPKRTVRRTWCPGMSRPRGQPLGRGIAPSDRRLCRGHRGSGCQTASRCRPPSPSRCSRRAPAAVRLLALLPATQSRLPCRYRLHRRRPLRSVGTSTWSPLLPPAR